MAVTHLDKIIPREFAPIVRTNRFDLTVVPHVCKELLEGLVRFLLLLQEVHPGVSGVVVAYNHGVVAPAIGSHGSFPTEVDEHALKFRRRARGGGGGYGFAVALTLRASGTRLQFPS